MRSQPEVREQMFKLIEQWQQSRLTQNTFCEQQFIRYHVFHYWYKRYREQHADQQSNVMFKVFSMAQILSPTKPCCISAPAGTFSITIKTRFALLKILR